MLVHDFRGLTIFLLTFKETYMAKLKLDVKGFQINIDEGKYISLTDIAKSSSKRQPNQVIRSWLRNRGTIGYLDTWEEVHNPNFKSGQMATFRKKAEDNRSIITAQTYIEQTGAIGITSKAGCYGGTYAHPDIAINFCYWLSPQFQVYFIKEFQRLKHEEALRLGDPFNIKRFLTAGSYSLLVNSLLSKVDERLLTHPQPYKKRLPFAAEADMINQIVFGESAKQWRFNNPNAPTNRNQRDFASVLELVVLNCLEVIDAMLIQWDVVELKERQKILQDTFDFIHPILKRTKTIQDLQKLADKANQ